MSILAHIVLISWFPLVLLVSAVANGPRTIVTMLVIGWLALPNAEYQLSGLPDYNKSTATVLALATSLVVFSSERLRKTRLHWCDTFPFLVVVSCFASSLANGLGPYDGASWALDAAVSCLIPYYIGRIWLGDVGGLKLLTLAIVCGGLAYIPLCLFEIRMSPQLHNWIYGFMHRWNGGGYRYGGYRPIVFLDGGLQLGMWMTSASLIGAWLWWKGVWRSTFCLQAGWWLLVLVGTTILCRSTGALLLLGVGIAVLAFTQFAGSKLALIAVLLVCPVFVAVRITGALPWEPVVEAAGLISDERARSLRGRFVNEDLLMAKALERPVFGWGRWGRNRIYDDYGNDLTVTDGQWIIALGQNGLIGLVSNFAVLLLPLSMLLIRFSPDRLTSSELAPSLAVAVTVAICAIDRLLNYMPAPIYPVAVGAVVGTLIQTKTAGMAREANSAASQLSMPSTGANVLPRHVKPRS